MSRHLLRIRTSPSTFPLSQSARSLFCKARAMSSSIQPNFSSGTDVTALQEALKALSSPEGGKWRLTSNGMGLERTFKFKTFKKTWEFMNVVAAECGKQKHHPEWSNVYNTTFVRWTTHHPRGLSAKDISMAEFCSAQASLFGVIEEEPTANAADTNGGSSEDLGKALADQVAVESADCCVPKQKK